MNSMDKDKLINVSEKFGHKRIAVVGDVMLDKYVYGRIDRINPENPAAPLIKVERKEFRLGGAANVALNIASVGANVTLFCICGNDHHGVVFEELCKDKKINIVDVKEGNMLVKERAIESEHNKYIMRADDGEFDIKEISAGAATKLLESLENSDFDAVILSDYNKSIFLGDFGEKIIEWARKKNIPSVVDPKPANVSSFKFSTALCPNINEARNIIGSKSSDEKDVAKKIREIVDNEYMVITCGKNGIIGFDGDNFIESPTKVRDLIDVTGAGDTVTSMMALGLVCELNLEEAMNLANYAAGVVVGKSGTSTLSKEELIEMIRTDGIF
jgi:D-glycero-beta-D-manno-heptose-7-phosphate kinase